MLLPGDEIVSAGNLYGGTYTMFDSILPKLGINVKFVNNEDPQGFKSAISDKTRAIYIETIGNPVLDFTDIAAIADIAHSHGLPLIVGHSQLHTSFAVSNMALTLSLIP